MNRFALPKTLLLALVAIGGFTSVGVSEANAGWYGRRCYTPSYSYCSAPTVYRPMSYSYCSPTYVQNYSPLCSYSYPLPSYSSWFAPTYYSPVTISSYSYGGGYGCFPQAYGGYGYGGGCYGFATPASYGQCGW